LGNVRQEASRHFWNKKREYLKDKIELESDSKNKGVRYLHRNTTEFKKDYQPRTNLVKDERSDILVDSHKIVSRWENYFCQLLHVQYVGQVLLSRLKWIQQSHLCQSLSVTSEVDVAIGKFCLRLIRFQHN
jgi:hypothetical protein